MSNQPPSAGIQRGILAPAPSSRRKPPKPQQHPNQQQHTFRTQMSTPLTTSGSTTPHSDRTMSPALMQVLPMPGHQHGVSLSASPIRYDPAAQPRRLLVPAIDAPRERSRSPRAVSRAQSMPGSNSVTTAPLQTRMPSILAPPSHQMVSSPIMGAAGSLAARLHELRVQEQIALEHHRAMEKARSEERDRLLDAVLSRPRSLTAPTVVPQTTLALNPLTGSPVGTLAGGNLIMLQGSPLPFLPPPIGLDLVQPQRSPPLVPSIPLNAVLPDLPPPHELPGSNIPAPAPMPKSKNGVPLPLTSPAEVIESGTQMPALPTPGELFRMTSECAKSAKAKTMTTAKTAASLSEVDLSFSAGTCTEKPKVVKIPLAPWNGV